MLNLFYHRSQLCPSALVFAYTLFSCSLPKPQMHIARHGWRSNVNWLTSEPEHDSEVHQEWEKCGEKSKKSTDSDCSETLSLQLSAC